MQYGGNAEFNIDGERLIWGDKVYWRGAMITDVPNLWIVAGYATASWTLGAQVTADLACRMISNMKRKGRVSATPRLPKGGITLKPKKTGRMGLKSGYIMEGMERLPKYGLQKPWLERGSYLGDLWDVKFGNIDLHMQYTLVPK